MGHRHRGFTLLEVLVVIAVLAVLLGLLATRLRTGGLEVDQAVQRLARTLERATVHAVDRNAFVLVTVDETTQRIEVTRHPDASDLANGTQVSVLDFSSGDLERLSFDVAEGLSSPFSFVFDPRGVGQGILVSSGFAAIDVITVTVAHEDSGHQATVALNRYAAVEVTP